MTSALFGLPDGSGCSWFGQLFVMACYGFILFKAAVLIGNGSEKLLLIYGPGIVGGLLIPILGAVPDGAIVLVSGLGTGDVQCQVSTGVGTLAGSTIMLLTIPWAISLFLGWKDYDPNTGEGALLANGRPKCTKFRIQSSCVTTYENTVYSAKIMIITSISYLIVLIPAIINRTKSTEQQIESEHIPALVGFIVCALGFIGYSVFQLFDSKAQTTIQMKQTKLQFLKWKQSVGRKVASTDNAIKVVFKKFDKDNNGTIDRQELKEGFKMLGLELDRSQVMSLMDEYNVDDDKDTLTEDEFSQAIKKWSTRVMSKTAVINLSRKGSRAIFGGTGDDIEMGNDDLRRKRSKAPTIQTVDENQEQEEDAGGSDVKQPLNKKKKKGYQSVDQDDEDEIDKKIDDDDDEFEQELSVSSDNLVNKMLKDLQMENEMEMEDEEEEEFLHLTDAWLIFYACLELLFGTILVVIFSDPMVSVIDVFAVTVNVNSFYISFIITPIASNASEIYSSLLFASKKSVEGISMGFSALYGAACMNNTFVLCIFCALVFFRELRWTFIAETIVILLCVILVGCNGMKKTVYSWQGIGVILIFPLSLVLVALLDPVLDDSSC